MSDKRKVSTDALETLGTIIDNTQKRDAIHLAVEPVIAGENLYPGAHITVKDGVATMTKVGQGLGIVDPFLPELVQKGQRFWFVMYPRAVHSLRHVWTHPAFADEALVPSATVTEVKVTLLHPEYSLDESQAWIRRFASSCDVDYDDLMQAVDTGSSSPDKYGNRLYVDDDYIMSYGSDAHGEIPDEFWDHAENVLNKKLTIRPSFFSCSC